MPSPINDFPLVRQLIEREMRRVDATFLRLQLERASLEARSQTTVRESGRPIAKPYGNSRASSIRFLKADPTAMRKSAAY